MKIKPSAITTHEINRARPPGASLGSDIAIRTMRRWLTVGCVFCILLGTGLRAHAGIFTVTTSADSGPGSLRQAILDANSAPGADVIQFSGFSGTITLTSGELRITESLTINGPGPKRVTISGNNSSRIFGTYGSETDLSVTRINLVEGRADVVEEPLGNNAYGGAILHLGRILSVEDVGFGRNLAIVGGCISIGGGGGPVLREVTISKSTLIENLAVSGGAIANWGHKLTVTDSTFNGNSAQGGGGIINYDHGEVTLTDCTFSGNSAVGAGGAILNDMPSAVFVYSSTLIGNSASAGGAIFSRANVIINDSKLAGNSADDGGGIFTSGPGQLIVTSSEIVNNKAKTRGGGIFSNSDADLTDCVVNANSVSSSDTALGGGIYAHGSSSSLKLTNCNVNGNKAIGTVLGQGGGIHSDGFFVNLQDCVIKGNKASTAFDNIYLGP